MSLDSSGYSTDLGIARTQAAFVGCVGEAYCRAHCALELTCAAIGREGLGREMKGCEWTCLRTLRPSLEGPE
jgi:hypothetical protein